MNENEEPSPDVAKETEQQPPAKEYDSDEPAEVAIVEETKAVSSANQLVDEVQDEAENEEEQLQERDPDAVPNQKEIRLQRRWSKQRAAAAMRQDKDQIYCADQEEEDYALSTEDDSGAVMRPSKKIDSEDTSAKDGSKKADKPQNKGKSRSVKQTNTIGQQVNNRLRKVWHKFCEWPGIYSMLLAVILAYSLIFFETSVGAKIA